MIKLGTDRNQQVCYGAIRCLGNAELLPQRDRKINPQGDDAEREKNKSSNTEDRSHHGKDSGYF